MFFGFPKIDGFSWRWRFSSQNIHFYIFEKSCLRCNSETYSLMFFDRLKWIHRKLWFCVVSGKYVTYGELHFQNLSHSWTFRAHWHIGHMGHFAWGTIRVTSTCITSAISLMFFDRLKTRFRKMDGFAWCQENEVSKSIISIFAVLRKMQMKVRILKEIHIR
jgi:hypothetical protein